MANIVTEIVPPGVTQSLAFFLADLAFADLPTPAVERTKELFLDWIGAALAGSGAPPVAILERFAQTMGPAGGPSEILVSRRRTSPMFAALVNGAASHVVEQDDVHNGAVFHPATVVFPAALATAQHLGSSGRDLLTACVAGYEAGIRVGAYLGRSHYRVFHTTGTAGTLAAAVAVSHLLGSDREIMVHAMGTAGTQAAGLWEFLRDAGHSKQLHTAKAAANGVLAGYVARDGFTGARRILEGPQGMAAGMSSDADPSKLTEGLGRSWGVLETSFKLHASCRHTHPSADALLQAMLEHNLDADEIVRVRAHVHQAALDVLGAVTDPRTEHQAKFSMGFVLALIALRGRASVTDFDDISLDDPDIRAFHDRVDMVLDPEIDGAYPQCWIGLVEVETVNGTVYVSRVGVPKGDPENSLTRIELEQKLTRLAEFRGAASMSEIQGITGRVWDLEHARDVRDLFIAPQS